MGPLRLLMLRFLAMERLQTFDCCLQLLQVVDYFDDKKMPDKNSGKKKGSANAAASQRRRTTFTGYMKRAFGVIRDKGVNETMEDTDDKGPTNSLIVFAGVPAVDAHLSTSTETEPVAGRSDSR